MGKDIAYVFMYATFRYFSFRTSNKITRKDIGMTRYDSELRQNETPKLCRGFCLSPTIHVHFVNAQQMFIWMRFKRVLQQSSDRWKISPFSQTASTSHCLIANNIEENNCVSGSPTRQQPSQENKLKFENNMSISRRWWEQIHLLLWQSVIWKQKYDFISPLGNHCNHKCQCVCVCLHVRLC